MDISVSEAKRLYPAQYQHVISQLAESTSKFKDKDRHLGWWQYYF